MRLDRAISVHLSHPVSRWLIKRRGARIPILMYHAIKEGARTRHPYYETNTSPQVFAQQMQFLRENSYTVLSLEDALSCLEAGMTNGKCAVITFDDGNRDFFTQAYPILSKYNFAATVFLVTGLLKDDSSDHNGTGHLTWREVQELHTNGVQIGSHAVTHPELTTLDAKQVDYEVGFSKKTIEDEIGCPVKAFSYPYAFPEADRKFTRSLKEMLIQHGYEYGVSTMLGTAGRRNDRFFLPRLPVNTWDDPSLFRSKLEGGYDWLHWPQWLYKIVKRGAVPIRNWEP